MNEKETYESDIPLIGRGVLLSFPVFRPPGSPSRPPFRFLRFSF